MDRQWKALFFSLALVLTPYGGIAADLSVTVRDGDGSPVADAVVFVPSDTFTPQDAASEMVQRSEMFNPFVLPVATGTLVEFPNEDPFRHHVYSFSPAKQFELKLYGGDEVQRVAFDTAGEVALGCNIHDNMLGYIYVVDTNIFGKTDESGIVTLTGLPDGTAVEAQVWHPRLRGPVRRTAMQVTAGEPAAFEIRLRPDRRRQGNDFEDGGY